MKYRKSNQVIYNYSCSNCGNEFERDYDCHPNVCQNCHHYGTFEMEIISVEVFEQFCPICETFFETSEYLNQEIKDEHVRWLANEVTHYRHNHISSWNKMWGRNGGNYRSGWFDNDYDELKILVNERAKRQILRKGVNYMKENGFTVDHVKQLSHSDEKTIELYEKILGKEQKIKLAS